MATVKEQGQQAQAEAFALDDFSALLQKEFKPNDDARKGRIEEAVQTLAQQALADAAVIGEDVFSTVDAMRAALDKKLSEQINLIIHNEEFQKLESAWRGLQYLVMNTSTVVGREHRRWQRFNGSTRFDTADARAPAVGRKRLGNPRTHRIGCVQPEVLVMLAADIFLKVELVDRLGLGAI